MEHFYDQAIAAFEQATDELLRLLSPLTEEQLNQVLVSGKWTPGQLGLHLYKSYASVYILQGNTKATERPIDEKVPLAKSVLLNFEASYDAPQEVVPPNRYIKREKLLRDLRARIALYRKVIRHHDLSATCTDFAIPQYGAFTRLEWLCFDTFHTQRHVRQLKQQLAG